MFLNFLVSIVLSCVENEIHEKYTSGNDEQANNKQHDIMEFEVNRALYQILELELERKLEGENDTPEKKAKRIALYQSYIRNYTLY